MKLYEIAAQYREALEALQDAAYGEQSIKDTLEGLQGELSQKVEAVAAVVLNIEARAKAMERAAKNMQERCRAEKARAEAARKYLKETLDSVGMTSLHTPQFDLKIKRNPPALEVVDDSIIPPQFWVTPEPELDTGALKEALKNGEDIKGARLTQATRLEIK